MARGFYQSIWGDISLKEKCVISVIVTLIGSWMITLFLILGFGLDDLAEQQKPNSDFWALLGIWLGLTGIFMVILIWLFWDNWKTRWTNWRHGTPEPRYEQI